MVFLSYNINLFYSISLFSIDSLLAISFDSFSFSKPSFWPSRIFASRARSLGLRLAILALAPARSSSMVLYYVDKASISLSHDSIFWE